MTTNTIAMYGDDAQVDVLSGGTAVGTVVPVTDMSALPLWRVREAQDGVAPITAHINGKHNSTRVSVPGCRGTT